jgi:cytochrome P450
MAPSRRSLVRAIAQLASLYGASVIVQVVIKLLRSSVQMRRMTKMLADVPKAKMDHDSWLGNIPAFLANIDRRHDFIANATMADRVTWTHGLAADPGSVEIFVNDPAGVKHFLKENANNYTKPPSDRDFFWHHLRTWLGDGIFTARHGVDAEDKGHGWMKQRKIAAAIFTRTNFNSNMNDVFVSKARHFCNLLQSSAKEGEQVDMQMKFFNYTMDSIMQIFFGEASDTLNGQPNAYATAYDTAHRGLVDFLMKNIAVLAMLKMLPWPLGGHTGLLARRTMLKSESHSQFREARKLLEQESRRMVQSSRADPQLADRKDLLALFLQVEEQERFTDKWLQDVVLNFVIAGRDTTACTLSWMFYILATNPEIQAKVQEEIDEHLPADTDITFKTVGHSELPYLHGVLYETLRLYPPVPIDTKEAVADDVLPDGTPVPAHAKLNFTPYTMGRDPTRYTNPEMVIPERWIPFKEPQPHEFPVFQAGPRICLGMNMAIFEAKIVAGMLLRDYTFTLAPGEAEKITYLPTALTMSICNSKTHDSHNLWLIPKPRQ